MSLAMKYAVIIEKTDANFGAYVPDSPGCVAAAETRSEVVALIGEAISLHIEAMKEKGDKILPPSSSAIMIEVSA